jgi:hypothetical protein
MALPEPGSRFTSSRTPTPELMSLRLRLLRGRAAVGVVHRAGQLVDGALLPELGRIRRDPPRRRRRVRQQDAHLRVRRCGAASGAPRGTVAAAADQPHDQRDGDPDQYQGPTGSCSHQCVLPHRGSDTTARVGGPAGAAVVTSWSAADHGYVAPRGRPPGRSRRAFVLTRVCSVGTQSRGGRRPSLLPAGGRPAVPDSREDRMPGGLVSARSPSAHAQSW